MKNTILKSTKPEILTLENEIITGHMNLLKKDFSAIDKLFFLYDAKELSKLSKVAIVSDNLILIHVDTFKHAKDQISKLNILESLNNGNLTGSINFSPKDLLKNLRDNKYEDTAQRVENLLSPDGANFKATEKEAKYLKKLINKEMPKIVHEFNKSKDINPVLEFIANEQKSIKDLSYIGFGLLVNKFNNNSMIKNFGFSFDSNNKEKIAIAFISFANNNSNYDSNHRLILIDELSGANDFKVGLEHKSQSSPFKP